MSIQSERGLAATREKLRILEARVAILKSEPAEHPHLRELTIRSLMSLINQFKEEIIRYESATGRSVDLSLLSKP
jgi:hypothetical protein